MSRVKLKKDIIIYLKILIQVGLCPFCLLPLIGFNRLHLYSSPMMPLEPTTIPKLELTKYSLNKNQ